ncbi:serine/threonine protein kinase [Pseudomarimonas arenosa]|uniref:Stress response kinase A n=1 Tax=Pseudomarimonas arenosa TaxID=2774145 RepID=A0AAW3ZJC5_9GAMM|nr:serine/threonine protein kinase [Pseudomarimonas arenosa]MBD8524797.1 serine/threonine protein kinase [Pseudomarimonas arenosa]
MTADARGGLPFAELTHAEVLDRLAELDVHGDGGLLALNSYENRVFRLRSLSPNRALVAKFYRPARWSDEAILEEHAFSAELAAAEVPVVGPLSIAGRSLHHLGPYRVAVFPSVGGRAPDLERREVLISIGRQLARLHNVGAQQTFRHRPHLDIEAYGDQPLDALLDSELIPESLKDSLADIGDRLLDQVETRWQWADPALIRLHGDCHAGNVLAIDEVIHLLDLDDCLTGPAVQDLWMLVAGEHSTDAQPWQWLLRGYREFREFDERELLLTEALRAQRLLHFHAWVCQRWIDPAFPLAFPWFAERPHWERFLQQLREQLALLQEPMHPFSNQRI